MIVEQLHINKEEFQALINAASTYKTEFYEIEAEHAGEVRFGPEYKFIKIFSRGMEVWDGGMNIYGEESFQHNVLCDEYDKLILIKWFSTSDPYQQLVVEINLKTGKETELDMKQRYWEAGHFNTFDGVFYRKSDIKDFLCKDFQAKSDFLLFERINEKINNTISWGLSTVKDCITVYTKEKSNNILTYDIRKKEVLNACTFDFQLSPNGKIYSRLNKIKNEIIVYSYDYNLDADNRFVDIRSNYLIIKERNNN